VRVPLAVHSDASELEAGKAELEPCCGLAGMVRLDLKGSYPLLTAGPHQTGTHRCF
jgi:hypothetical protein